MCVLEYDYDVVLRCSFVLCVMCHDSNSDEIPMNTSRSYSLFLISSSYPLLLPPLYSFAFLLPFTDLLLTSFIPPSSFLLPPSSFLPPPSFLLSECLQVTPHVRHSCHPHSRQRSVGRCGVSKGEERLVDAYGTLGRRGVKWCIVV